MSKSTAPTGWGVWTWPNLVTAVRLLGIPLFCYLLLATEYYWQAAVVLAVGGGTDWVDGQLARRLNQVSKLGRLLDPFVDRLYILTALLALTYVELLPWPFTLAVLIREAVLVSTVVVLRWHGFAPPQVHFLGKSATSVMFMSFPVLVVAGLVNNAAGWAAPLGWALAWWGLGLYWLAAFVYLRQAAGLLRGRSDHPHAVALPEFPVVARSDRHDHATAAPPSARYGWAIRSLRPTRRRSRRSARTRGFARRECQRGDQVIPEQLRYTAEHEWIEQRDGDVVRVGITDFAQSALGDVVFVQLPEAGARVQAGDVIGEVESTKSVSDVYAPVTGRIQACNGELSESPELVNGDPYQAGWMFDMEVEDSGSLAALLDAGAYAKLTE